MMEGCQTGLEQLLHVCSDLDMAQLQAEFGHCLTQDWMVHTSVADLGVLPTTEILREWLDVSSRLSQLVQIGSRIFQLMVLLVLFPKGGSSYGSPSIPSVRKRYLRYNKTKD